MTLLDIERAELNAFSLDVETGSARSLELLHAIDGTISWLTRLNSQLMADATFAESILPEGNALSSIIDDDGTIADQLLKARDTVNSLHELLTDKQECARNDCQLTDEDGIEDAYTMAISSAADLHNSISGLVQSIGEHDATLSPKSKAYGNAEELLKDLSA